ncbi:MAG: hypothetical protein KAS25_02790, partial [Dehalococcoidales bacterium]|nr:hypothetical protein [Dehalococcoidales bacterium]
MLKVKKRNLGWTDIDMDKIQLSKLVSHFNQCLKAEGKSPKTVSWYEEMLSVLTRYLESSGIIPILA